MPRPYIVRTGVLAKERIATDRRKESYTLTGKGLALIPILVELANWGVRYDPEVVFSGENSVIDQFQVHPLG
jgi:DNA-binding HxlR family transcriptional regulator